MSDGRKKLLPSRETGTVPKVKYWKNATVEDTHVSNNLASSLMPNVDRSLKCEPRNRQRCANHECLEGSCIDDYKIFPNYNSLPHINMSSEVSRHNTSTPAHARQSGGTIRKCDNVTKYPDKQQIERKLDQIREYVKVTNSLMSNLKEDQINHESDAKELHQMLSALRDSEKKLEYLLVSHEMNEQPSETASVPNHEDFENTGSVQESQEQQIFNMFQNNVSQQNEVENKLLISEKKLQALHQHQSILVQLQEKAENQMKDARKAQERLAAHANSFPYAVSPVLNGINQQEQKNDKNKYPESPDSREANLQDQMNMMNPTNDGREQMLRLLDARDSELCNEQIALQQKLLDLNTKKQQIDQLVSQLQNYSVNDEEGTDEMARQIKQIVAMKEQLATLKDMLSMVKSTEADLLRQNSIASAMVEQQSLNVKSGNMAKAESVGRAESVSSDRRWGSIGKQSNKSSISSSREQLQAELQAKKQELEEFMYKDQDHTSAINRDVCNELMMDKGDPSFSLDSVPSSWTLLQDNSPPRESCMSRENVYSSDEDEIPNYTQLNNAETSKAADYDQSNFRKQVPCRPVMNCNSVIQDSPSSPALSQNWNGVEQKQVELMTNLCQSLLEQQRHMLPNQFSVPNFQWYASYMQTQHSLMLSTISQCCQLLWLQQQDINTLMNTVALMQQQGKSFHPAKISQVPIESVSSACSLPNLSSRMGSSNTQYAMLSREPNCSTPGHSNSRNSTIPVLGQQTQPIWSGSQALNNQVAPGNRANNYWDNFRSYSRQNLLSTSTKSNEGSQNSLPVLERNIGNTAAQTTGHSRSQPSTLYKMNSRMQARNSAMELNNYPQPQQGTQQNTRQNQPVKPPKRNKAPSRNRNEWNKNAPQPENLSQKSKLFDILRENVYKEVTLLISANENRPHFLIQLFRDLQLLSSDPLRRSALQSIQSLITHSIGEAPNVGHENLILNSVENEQLMKIYPSIPEQIKPPDVSTTQYCPQQNGSVNSIEDFKLDSEAHHVLMEILPFIKSHSDDIMHSNLIDVMKIMIFQLLPAKHFAADNKLHSKLDILLSDSLMKYQGRRISDIKEEILKTIADILLEVLQNTSIVKDHSVIADHLKSEDTLPNPMLFLPTTNAHVLPFEFMNLGNVRSVDNGDLAEADQSTQEAENEEGAVGGMILPTTEDHDLQTNNNCDVCF